MMPAATWRRHSRERRVHLNLETERPKEAVEVELPPGANLLGPASAAKAHPDLFSVFFGI
jgi:hypothetical protein